MNPNLAIVRATSSVFRVEDSGDQRFYLLASLGSGLLRFEVLTRLSDGTISSVRGKEFFDAMMNHFGARVKVIEGNWTLFSGLTDNIDQLNAATARGLTIAEAATLTWTGRRAADYGYNKVTVLYVSRVGTQGNYDAVRVHFGK